MNKMWTPKALAMLLTATAVSAFPQLLVNKCNRTLEIGEVIMQVAVAPSANAPADQRHTLGLSADLSSDASDTFTDLCGSTANQGDALSIQVDPALVGAVSASGWAAGVGPNYILEAEGGVIEAPLDIDPADKGCQGSRQVNPHVAPTVYPLQAGTMVVRLLSAYTFGQVWASPECTVTIEGTRTVAQHDGYLVDNASWEASSELASMPYTLSADQLLEGASSGFSVLELSGEDEFSVKYTLDEAANNKAATFLQSLAENATDIQVSVAGFVESENTVSLVSLSSCASADTCDGFYTVPTDQVCLGPGLCIESSIVDEVAGTLTTTITSDDGAFRMQWSFVSPLWETSFFFTNKLTYAPNNLYQQALGLALGSPHPAVG